ncbi:aldehyde dehydrogenase family protein [Epilithonimonas ginsengisoli]|uniref:Aldehyde dehydrogenase family protein n=1 Tax=Epilithonimonas ginsengisoli TaxID=1245592 RepID=A0ABU4JHN3_9FLAO|nr:MULTISPECIES: aldehyde dehydrogenase family protein [Chryseobacterium group]MBV6880643.1 aldehyde dehydrogenase family protein [Epilithonimonas sp. FP105]MDW8549188.1 aldehyde dehydrogenase family protein [Epilithonimonas ginsengisoli]OAH70383.1 aldehyde dehydrogenase [Chryseobacterium sp. FP211-J200]
MNLSNHINSAQKTFLEWKKVPFTERQTLLLKLADVLEKDKEKFANLITTEMHKPISQSIAEIEKSAGMIRYYAKAENVLKPEKIKTEFEISEVHYDALGIILGVMPWNFPFWQVLRFAVPAILAGNVILLKHASICFESGDAVEKVFKDAGFPEYIFQNLRIGHEEIKEILENPFVRGVSLTGSEKAGANVAALAGKNIKKSVLELGGSDAYIVLDDADVEKAATEAPSGKLQNTGQVCNAAKRFIVHQKVEKDFVPKFVEEFNSYQPADPFKKETKLSKMARPDLADELESQYKKALRNGAEVVLALERISESEFRPGIILVKEGNPILQEELFGPLAMLMVGKDDEEILKLANDIPFGLGNSVWTKDKKRAQFFIENLESGTVSINKSTSSDARLPFGGAKSSGYGVELSLHAIKEFTQIKTVVGNI